VDPCLPRRLAREGRGAGRLALPNAAFEVALSGVKGYQAVSTVEDPNKRGKFVELFE